MTRTAARAKALRKEGIRAAKLCGARLSQRRRQSLVNLSARRAHQRKHTSRLPMPGTARGAAPMASYPRGGCGGSSACARDQRPKKSWKFRKIKVKSGLDYLSLRGARYGQRSRFMSRGATRRPHGLGPTRGTIGLLPHLGSASLPRVDATPHARPGPCALLSSTRQRDNLGQSVHRHHVAGSAEVLDNALCCGRRTDCSRGDQGRDSPTSHRRGAAAALRWYFSHGRRPLAPRVRASDAQRRPRPRLSTCVEGRDSSASDPARTGRAGGESRPGGS